MRSQPRAFRASFVTAVAVADNPWDQATKGGFPTNETAAAIADARRMTAILEETNADGVFGDGNGGGNGVMSRFFRNGVAAQHPAALQSEGGGSPDSMMNFTTMGWGYWQCLLRQIFLFILSTFRSTDLFDGAGTICRTDRRLT